MKCPETRLSFSFLLHSWPENLKDQSLSRVTCKLLSWEEQVGSSVKWTILTCLWSLSMRWVWCASSTWHREPGGLGRVLVLGCSRSFGCCGTVLGRGTGLLLWAEMKWIHSPFPFKNFCLPICGSMVAAAGCTLAQTHGTETCGLK
jgi:hypothetical protein